jgi:hypothetical protein
VKLLLQIGRLQRGTSIEPLDEELEQRRRQRSERWRRGVSLLVLVTTFSGIAVATGTGLTV